MYYFFRSWRDSLSLFIPQNAKLFSLVTLKTIINSYKKILKDLWWLFLVSAAVEYGFRKLCIVGSLWCIVPLLLWLAIIFIMYLIIRPSIPQKNWHYYLSHWYYFIYFALFSALAISLPYIFLSISQKIAAWTLYIHPIFFYLYIPFLFIPILLAFIIAPEVLPIYSSPLLSFFLFFLIDSRGSILDSLKSVWRALKMVVYNYPFCLLFYTALLFGTYYLQQLIRYVFGPTNFLFSTLVGTLALAIPLCIWSVFYTKRLHDQFNLYYPESVKE